jgi:hypothetical protein
MLQYNFLEGEGYSLTLSKAFSDLELLKADYRSDFSFRKFLHEDYNVERPEAVLLFLYACNIENSDI